MVGSSNLLQDDLPNQQDHFSPNPSRQVIPGSYPQVGLGVSAASAPLKRNGMCLRLYQPDKRQPRFLDAQTKELAGRVVKVGYDSRPIAGSPGLSSARAWPSDSTPISIPGSTWKSIGEPAPGRKASSPFLDATGSTGRSAGSRLSTRMEEASPSRMRRLTTPWPFRNDWAVHESTTYFTIDSDYFYWTVRTLRDPR
jgi:hypothetical protein